MIRRSQISISESNPGKLSTLGTLFLECQKVINLYIYEIWKNKDFESKYVDFKVDTWLSSRMQQNLGKQALSIVKSQRKKKKPHKPVFKSLSFDLDSRFIDVQFDNNSFDIWIHLQSIGNKINLKLPGNKHKHYHKYDNWTLKKSVKIRKVENRYFIDLFFEKETPELKLSGKTVGIDVGYKKLITSSENKVYDTGLERIYEKISRKKQKSKAFKRSLKERDNKINESINRMPLEGIKTLIVERLKDVKRGSKGRIYKKFNNKLQRWSYRKVFDMLSLRCEELGVFFKEVNPAYTSQTCSSCGFKHKNNRLGEKFLCLDCGNTLDADYNASLNILALGSL